MFAKFRGSLLYIVEVFLYGRDPFLRLETSLIVVEMDGLEQVERESNILVNAFRVILLYVFVKLHA